MDAGNAVNFGVAGAVIVVVGLFLRHLYVAQKESRAEREQERKVLTDIITNDLAHVGEGLAKNVETLQDVAHGLREVRKGLERLNGKG